MDLHDEFERHAHARASESGARLRGAAVRSRLAGRVTRGRRIRNVTVGAGTVAAVGVLAVGAVMVPRLGDGASSTGSTPSPSGTPAASMAPGVSTAPGDDQAATSAPSPSAARVDVAGMPALGTSDYLVVTSTGWNVAGPPTCEALAASGPEDGVATDLQGQRFPVPSWLETGRLYGWGDDVLVGGTPIPVAATGRGDFAAVQEFVSNFTAEPGNPSADLTELILTGADGSVWAFTLSWSDRDNLPYDPVGTFITMSPIYDCNEGIPPAGVYDARLAMLRADNGAVIMLSPITILDGVPSLPLVDATGR